MKKEIADLWVADLRTNPPQHRGELKNLDGPGHCCLGRLCVVLGMEQELVHIEYDAYDHHYEEGPREVLSSAIIDASEMRTGNFTGLIRISDSEISLADMNDAGRSFAEIADIIEKHWEEL